MHETSKSLLDRVKDHEDGLSWRRLVDLYGPFLERALRAHGVPATDIDDITQEVFGVVSNEIQSFAHSGRTGAFRHWLKQILVFRLRRYWQEKQRLTKQNASYEDTIDALADPENPFHQIWEREHNEYVTQRLLELIEPEFQATTWQAFHKQVLGELKASEVAEQLGISTNAALIAKSRVLRRLRKETEGLTD